MRSKIVMPDRAKSRFAHDKWNRHAVVLLSRRLPVRLRVRVCGATLTLVLSYSFVFQHASLAKKPSPDLPHVSCKHI
jgi:hypothetical protein